MGKMRAAKLPVNNAKEPSIYVDPGEEMPVITGYNEQIKNYVERYLMHNVQELPGIGDEIFKLFYSLEFEMAQTTASGKFVDMLSIGYLGASINNFIDATVNYNPASDIDKWYAEKNKAVKANIMNNVATDISSIEGISQLNKIINGPSESEKQLSTLMYQNQISDLQTHGLENAAKRKKAIDIINGKDSYDYHQQNYGGNVSMFG